MNQLQRVQSDDTGGLLSFIERAAKDPGFDLSKFGALLDRHEAVIRQHQLTLFNQAYSAMQSELKQILKTGSNPTFRNPYATMEDLDKAARPIYSKHGFSIRYGTKPIARENWICVTLTIAHDGGYSEQHELPGPMDQSSRSRTPIQTVGSTVTYLRRYLLQMVLNLVPRSDPADDDGEGQRFDPETGEVDAAFRKAAEQAATRGDEAIKQFFMEATPYQKKLLRKWEADLMALSPDAKATTGAA